MNIQALLLIIYSFSFDSLQILISINFQWIVACEFNVFLLRGKNSL
jgi:hypothetical protein